MILHRAPPPSHLFSCLVSSPDPTLTGRRAWGRHETTSCLPDIMHVIPSSRPSHSCILQSIKNWRRERPGNKPSHCLWLLPNKAPLRRIASSIRHMQLATHTQTHTHTHTHNFVHVHVLYTCLFRFQFGWIIYDKKAHQIIWCWRK